MGDAPTAARPEAAWAMALAQAQAQAPQIVKHAYNSHAGAKFAPASEYIALSRVLAEHGLLAFELASDVAEGPKGAVYLAITYAVAHTATGFERAFTHRQALAAQLSDKAVSAARTVGMRDFLRGLLLPEVVDGETGPGQSRPAPGRRGAAPRRQGGPRGQSARPAQQRQAGPRGVALQALPRALVEATTGPQGARVAAFDDPAVWSLTDVPSDRGEQLVVLVSEWLDADLARMADQRRAELCAHVAENRGALQRFAHQAAVKELAHWLAERGKSTGLPVADELDAQLKAASGDELVSLRRALELRVRGEAYGWEIGECPTCQGDSKKRGACKACKGEGTQRYPKAPPKGAAA